MQSLHFSLIAFRMLIAIIFSFDVGGVSRPVSIGCLAVEKYSAG